MGEVVLRGIFITVNTYIKNKKGLTQHSSQSVEKEQQNELKETLKKE